MEGTNNTNKTPGTTLQNQTSATSDTVGNTSRAFSETKTVKVTDDNNPSSNVNSDTTAEQTLSKRDTTIDASDVPLDDTTQKTIDTTIDNNVDLNDLPDNTKKELKKHSFVWFAFQKVKRFFHSLAIKNDPFKLTSKDFKEIPEHIKIVISDTDFVNKITQYNDARTQLILTEKKSEPISHSISHVKENLGKEIVDQADNKTDSSQIADQIANDIVTQRALLLTLSKDIFASAEKSILNTEKHINTTLAPQFSPAQRKKIIDIIKSQFSFNPNRVNPKSEQPKLNELKFTNESNESNESNA